MTTLNMALLSTLEENCPGIGEYKSNPEQVDIDLMSACVNKLNLELDQKYQLTDIYRFERLTIPAHFTLQIKPLTGCLASNVSFRESGLDVTDFTADHDAQNCVIALNSTAQGGAHYSIHTEPVTRPWYFLGYLVWTEEGTVYTVIQDSVK